MNSNKFFIISGPSGAGKNTVLECVQKVMPELEETISCTTRKIRSNEKNSEHYNFITKEEFKNKINNNEFLEYFDVHGQYYGTLKSELERIKNNNHIAIAILDVQGGLAVKKQNSQTVLIFIRPESLEVIKERLSRRRIDTQELTLRLKNAQNEMIIGQKYDYKIINKIGKIKETSQKIAEIIKNELSLM